MEAHEPTAVDYWSIRDIFSDADLSIIKSIYYFEGWSTYEEDGGLLIFQGIDDSIQMASWHRGCGYDCTGFDLEEIDASQAEQEINEMEEMIRGTL
jgi:hypothetical protein